MRPKPALFIFIAALCSVATAWATPLVFNVTGDVHGTRYFNPILPQTGTLSGTITFDPATFNAIAANITVVGVGFQFIDPSIPAVTSVPQTLDPIAPPPDYSLVQNGLTTVEVVQRNLDSFGLNFAINDALLTSTLGDPFGGTIQAYSSLAGNYYITNGLLTPAGTVSATPEPSSLILLGTGVISLAGAIRRRFLNS